MKASKYRTVGVITGSGASDLELARDFKKESLNTKYGKVNFQTGNLSGKNVILLPRHDFDHKFAPHQINYRANIQALKQKGTQCIIATAACGSLRTRLKRGTLATLSDFIDFTQNRIQTFEPEGKSVHIDMSHPYNAYLNKSILAAAARLRIKMPPGLVYICTEGPRFETRSEIKMFTRLGADVVGMTGVPEVVLSSEAKLPYASIAIVTNYACGLTKNVISDEEVLSVMRAKSKTLSQLISAAIESL